MMAMIQVAVISPSPVWEPPDARISLRPELVVLLVRPVAQDVQAGAVVLGGELDAGDQLDPDERGGLPGFREPGRGVVVGQRQDVEVTVPGQLEELLGAECPVRVVGVRVQVDAGHGPPMLAAT